MITENCASFDSLVSPPPYLRPPEVHAPPPKNDPLLDATLARLNIPPRPHNGGWYTGQAFAPDLYPEPIIPDTGYLTHYMMRKCNPPPSPIELYLYPGAGYRPGNNEPFWPGIDWFKHKNYTAPCLPAGCGEGAPRYGFNCSCPRCSSHLYYYL